MYLLRRRLPSCFSVYAAASSKLNTRKLTSCPRRIFRVCLGKSATLSIWLDTVVHFEKARGSGGGIVGFLQTKGYKL